MSWDIWELFSSWIRLIFWEWGHSGESVVNILDCACGGEKLPWEMPYTPEKCQEQHQKLLQCFAAVVCCGVCGIHCPCPGCKRLLKNHAAVGIKPMEKKKYFWVITRVLKNCRMDSGRHKGFQGKIKCLFRHLSHLLSSSAEFTVCYFASEKKKKVGLIYALILAALGWNWEGSSSWKLFWSSLSWAQEGNAVIFLSSPSFAPLWVFIWSCFVISLFMQLTWMLLSSQKFVLRQSLAEFQ